MQSPTEGWHAWVGSQVGSELGWEEPHLMRSWASHGFFCAWLSQLPTKGYSSVPRDFTLHSGLLVAHSFCRGLASYMGFSVIRQGQSLADSRLSLKKSLMLS